MIALWGSDEPRTTPDSASVTPVGGYKVPDPEAGSPWTVRGFVDDRGNRCARATYVTTEAFFRSPTVRRAFADGGLTTCLSEVSGVLLRAARRALRTEAGPRTVLYGVVDGGVRSLRPEESGASHELLVARNGSSCSYAQATTGSGTPR